MIKPLPPGTVWSCDQLLTGALLRAAEPDPVVGLVTGKVGAVLKEALLSAEAEAIHPEHLYRLRVTLVPVPEPNERDLRQAGEYREQRRR
jgi:hypothetical protein